MPLVAQCLALQWCAESGGAEISAESPGYQRETSFENSSPTVSSLHSWLTARCVPLPCLHAGPKSARLSPLHPFPVSPPSPRSLLQPSSQTTVALLAIKHARRHKLSQCKVVCAHTGERSRHLHTTTSLIQYSFWSHLHYTTFQPLF